MEEIAEIVDELENLIAVMNLPMNPEQHLKALKYEIPAIRNRLKKAYLAAGGEDVWAA